MGHGRPVLCVLEIALLGKAGSVRWTFHPIIYLLSWTFVMNIFQRVHLTAAWLHGYPLCQKMYNCVYVPVYSLYRMIKKKEILNPVNMDLEINPLRKIYFYHWWTSQHIEYKQRTWFENTKLSTLLQLLLIIKLFSDLDSCLYHVFIITQTWK